MASLLAAKHCGNLATAAPPINKANFGISTLEFYESNERNEAASKCIHKLNKTKGHMDEYENVARGKLKLKKDVPELKKKKKKKSKDKEGVKKYAEEYLKEKTEGQRSDNAPSKSTRQLTAAEIAFKKAREKVQNDKIKERAGVTHKQRVEKFNEYLDSLSEHFECSKVSWTK